jgi:hypothetical protein
MTAGPAEGVDRMKSFQVMLTALVVCSCAGVKPTGPGEGGGASAGASGGGASAGRGGAAGRGVTVDPAHDCINLECQQTTCLTAKCLVPACGELQLSKTTLSGTIYDPAGKVPIYNVVVYVPNAPLDPISEGVSCAQCAGTTSGKPLASALTDASGRFTLENPPVGKNIPLVIQVGKWRREVTVPEILPCANNTLTDVNLSRLPRNQAEGHIPLIALTTGHSDALECLLRKIGIADEEFTTDAGSGRVHMFVGGDVPPKTGGQGATSFASGGQAFPNAATLWGSPDKLAKYDMMILSCEGSQYASAKEPYYANVKQYADRGGRIFDDHLHFNWILKGPPPWPTTAGWIGVGSDLGNITAKIDTSFPKGVAFADWLTNVGASTTTGQIGIVMTQNSVSADVQPVSQRWIYADSPTPAVQYLTFNTPVEAPVPMQCGRVVFTDIHVSASSGDVSHPETPFPAGCTSTNSSPQEKALEFMFFDLSSCVIDDRRPPEPPTVIP